MHWQVSWLTRPLVQSVRQWTMATDLKDTQARGNSIQPWTLSRLPRNQTFSIFSRRQNLHWSQTANIYARRHLDFISQFTQTHSRHWQHRLVSNRSQCTNSGHHACYRFPRNGQLTDPALQQLLANPHTSKSHLSLSTLAATPQPGSLARSSQNSYANSLTLAFALSSALGSLGRIWTQISTDGQKPVHNANKPK